MYYANDNEGLLINIAEAKAEKDYTCPVCDSPLIIKKGNMVAHHFAHKNGKVCDLRYFRQMSLWHKKMQDKFLACMREIKVWNDAKTKFHIADVLAITKEDTYVFEFQHSTISGNDFIERTEFYLDLGFKVVWIFDFKDIDKPKCFFYQEMDYDVTKRVIWPGSDRVRMFDSPNVRTFLDDVMCNRKNEVQVLFYISTGKGREYSCQYNEYSRDAWEYVDPFIRETYYIKPRFDLTDSLKDFSAYFFTEENVDVQISSYNKRNIGEFV